MKESIVITGASGFIGYNFLTRSKILDNYDVTGLYFKNKPSKIYGKFIKYKKVDLRDFQKCKELLSNFDIVLNASGIVITSSSFNNNFTKVINDNLLINSNILASLEINPPSKYIWISSTTGYPEYSKPLVEEKYFQSEVPKRYEIVGNLYRLIEKITNSMLLDKCEVITLRPTGVYGEGDNFEEGSAHMLPKIINKIVNETLPKKIYADTNELRNWIYVGNLVNALDQIIFSVNKSVEINLGNKNSTSMSNLYKKILKISKNERKYNLISTKDYYGKGLGRRICCRKSFELLGNYNLVSLDEGIERAFKWYRNNL